MKRVISKSSLIKRSRSLGEISDTTKATEQVAYSRSSIEVDFDRKAAVGLAEIISGSTSEIPTSLGNIVAQTNMEIGVTDSSSTAGLSKKFIVHQKHKVTTPTTKELANTSSKIAPHVSAALKAGLQKSATSAIPFECSCVKSVHENEKQFQCLDTTVCLSVMEAWQCLFSFESLNLAFCQKLWKKLGFTG